MSLLGGHLGARASALLDGQLSEEDAERCWAHVAECDACHDLVQREGWLKNRLAGLSCDAATTAPERLKGALLDGPTTAELLLGLEQTRHTHRRALAFAAFGGGAVGAAMVGLLAVGAGPAAAPTFHRQASVTTVDPGSTTVAFIHVARRAHER
ncbi:anti-sigma factor [Nocardioides sp. DS6]|uniref:Anti-sigma factor n=1 Tax=Nocardioides eburneus TaxID=3231482 RepID=A0ABV3SZW4_9ACTN